MIQGKRIVPLTVSCKQKTPIRQSMEGRMTKLTEIVNKLSLEVDHVDDHILDDQMMEGLKDDNEMRRIVEEGEGDNGEDGRMVLKDSVKQIMEIKEDCRVGVDKKKRIKMMCDEGGVREIKKKSKIVENKAVDEHKTVSKNYCVDKSKRKTQDSTLNRSASTKMIVNRRKNQVQKQTTTIKQQQLSQLNQFLQLHQYSSNKKPQQQYGQQSPAVQDSDQQQRKQLPKPIPPTIPTIPTILNPSQHFANQLPPYSFQHPKSTQTSRQFVTITPQTTQLPKQFNVGTMQLIKYIESSDEQSFDIQPSQGTFGINMQIFQLSAADIINRQYFNI